MTRARRGLALVAVGVLVGGGTAAGQDLQGRIETVDGRVAFHFPGRDGVEGCGDGSISFGEGHRYRWNGRERPSECGPGPVWVLLDRRDGEVRSLETRVGPRVLLDERKGTDLGGVDPRDAADYLLGLAEGARRGVAEDAILPAFLADGVEVWPRLLDLARDEQRPESVRSQALFWVGREAAGIGTDGIADVARDEDEDAAVRKAAVFALSQRPEEEGLPILMDLARNARDDETRRSAMFWLAQSNDPIVVDFFEEILAPHR